MPMSSAASREITGAGQARGVAGWLGLAASPTFALMAWAAAGTSFSMPDCSAGGAILPIDSMTAMYLLMSLFHLSPWLKLASSRARART